MSGQGAYSRADMGDDGGTPRQAEAAKQARRPPSPVEQARRTAWGREWGRVTSSASLNVRAKGLEHRD